MRRHTPSTDDTRRVLRARICATCPYRTAGTDNLSPDQCRPCELTCPLFIQLPHLREVVRQLDPLVGHPRRVIRKAVRGLGQVARPARRYTRKVADTIENIFRP